MKKNLRKIINKKLRELSSEDTRIQSAVIFTKLKSNYQFQKAKSVGVYMNMPNGEVQTMDIIKHCFQNSKKVFLPKCIDKTRMCFLRVEDMKSVEEMQPSGSFGIREPSSGIDLICSDPIDVILIPGVAFTPEGKRLGRGAAYYDRFLHDYVERIGSRPYLIGLSFIEQIIDEVPVEAHDWILDEVISGAS